MSRLILDFSPTPSKFCNDCLLANEKFDLLVILGFLGTIRGLIFLILKGYFCPNSLVASKLLVALASSS